MSDGISLALSTTVAPPKKISVDGSEYDLLGTDHLSPNDEAEAMALFARHSILQMELDATPNVQRGRDIAQRLRKCRLLVIGKLTTIPADVSEKLPLGAQVLLLEAIQAEVAGSQDDDGSSEDSKTETPGDGTAEV